MAILVTGGAGYIGSHTVIELLNDGEEVIIVDNLSNSSIEVIENIKKITKKSFKFYKINILNKRKMNRVFKENPNIETVIHFAGLKSVNESVVNPIKYYYSNIVGAITLLNVMKKNGCKNIVFSSSAAVYGDLDEMPIKEDSPTLATNPYGRTKLIIEQILKDIYEVDKEWSIVILRYFNPVGAHSSGLLGDRPKGMPSNLVPYISMVAKGEKEYLKIYGADYDTIDGTGVRDYIHVVDLAKGHIKAIDKLKESPGMRIYNLGTGRGYSVLEMVAAFEKVIGREINCKIVGRRKGDVAESYADVSKARIELKWEAKKDIEEMCRDCWKSEINNK